MELVVVGGSCLLVLIGAECRVWSFPMKVVFSYLWRCFFTKVTHAGSMIMALERKFRGLSLVWHLLHIKKKFRMVFCMVDNLSTRVMNPIHTCWK